MDGSSHLNMGCYEKMISKIIGRHSLWRLSFLFNFEDIMNVVDSWVWYGSLCVGLSHL